MVGVVGDDGIYMRFQANLIKHDGICHTDLVLWLEFLVKNFSRVSSERKTHSTPPLKIYTNPPKHWLQAAHKDLCDRRAATQVKALSVKAFKSHANLPKRSQPPAHHPPSKTKTNRSGNSR